jgi:hypothetical protein
MLAPAKRTSGAMKNARVCWSCYRDRSVFTALIHTQVPVSRITGKVESGRRSPWSCPVASAIGRLERFQPTAGWNSCVSLKEDGAIHDPLNSAFELGFFEAAIQISGLSRSFLRHELA